MIKKSLIISAFSAVLFLSPIAAEDFFHHIQSGRYILENLKLPYLDTTTFTAFGKYWIDYAWGSGLIYYLFYKLGGIYADIFYFALLGILNSLLFFFLLKKITKNETLSFLLTIFTSVSLSLYWGARPLFMGSILTVGLLLILEYYKKTKYFIPAYFFLWNILYGASALVGIAIFLFYLILNKRRMLSAWIIFMLSFIACFLNGYGTDSFFYVLQIPKLPYLQEWRSLLDFLGNQITIQTSFVILNYFVILISSISLFIYNIKNKKVSIDNLYYMILSIGIFLPFMSTRNINLAIAFAIPFLAININILSRDHLKTAYITLITIILIFTYIRFDHYDFGLGISKEIFPTGAVEFLNKNHISGNVFSTQAAGAYITFNSPSSKIYIDTRDDLFISTNIKNDEATMNLTQILDKYKANIVIWPKTNTRVFRGLIYSGNWKIIYQDFYFAVYVRT